MGEVAEQPMVLKEEHLSKPYQLYLLRILTGTLTEHEIKLHSTMQWIITNLYSKQPAGNDRIPDQNKNLSEFNMIIIKSIKKESHMFLKKFSLQLG